MPSACRHLYAAVLVAQLLGCTGRDSDLPAGATSPHNDESAVDLVSGVATSPQHEAELPEPDCTLVDESLPTVRLEWPALEGGQEGISSPEQLTLLVTNLMESTVTVQSRALIVADGRRYAADLSVLVLSPGESAEQLLNLVDTTPHAVPFATLGFAGRASVIASVLPEGSAERFEEHSIQLCFHPDGDQLAVYTAEQAALVYSAGDFDGRMGSVDALEIEPGTVLMGVGVAEINNDALEDSNVDNP